MDLQKDSSITNDHHGHLARNWWRSYLPMQLNESDGNSRVVRDLASSFKQAHIWNLISINSYFSVYHTRTHWHLTQFLIKCLCYLQVSTIWTRHHSHRMSATIFPLTLSSSNFHLAAFNLFWLQSRKKSGIPFFRSSRWQIPGWYLYNSLS